MNKIKKGDDVIVITGRDKNRRGTVSQVLANGKLVIEGVNVAKKHQKGNPQAGVAGGIVEKEMPIEASNVALYNAATGKADRIGYKFVGEGEARKKVRFFKSNQELVDR
jgi:large subunit ribosomal protein L24